MTDHVTMLRATVRDVMADVARARLRDGADEAVPAAWRRLEQVGVADLTGTGGDVGTLSDVLEVQWELAAGDVSVPFLETCVAGRWLAERSGLETPDGMLAFATWEGRHRVRWIRGAASAVVVDRAAGRVAVVAAGGPEVGRDVDGVGWGPLSPEALEAAGPWALLDASVAEELELRLVLATACGLVGAMESAIELGQVHASMRIQFGRPIRDFQAVRHALVGAHAEAHVAALAVRRAVAFVNRRDVARVEAAAALVRADEAARHVARTVHQLHGAIGLTEEHPLWRRTMRVWALREAHVDVDAWARELGTGVLAAADPWALITAGDVVLP